MIQLSEQEVAPIRIQEWPGGVRTLSGGTRADVKLNRPWQVALSYNPDSCPFCHKEQAEIGRYRCGGIEWRILQNRFTPHLNHYLYIPTEHFEPTLLYALGGENGIFAALFKMFRRAMDTAEVRTWWLGCHIGYSAGQNVDHLHWHMLEPREYRRAQDQNHVLRSLYHNKSAFHLPAIGEINRMVGGPRAGNCYFLHPEAGISAGTLENLAGQWSAALDQTRELYARKLVSEQGLAPDYMISIAICQRRLAYGMLTPILNQQGYTEMLALEAGGLITLPWPHEETVRYLLSD